MSPRHRVHPAWPLFQLLGLSLKEKMLPRMLLPLCAVVPQRKGVEEGCIHRWMGPQPVQLPPPVGRGDIEGEMWESGHSKIVEIQSFLPFHYRLRKKKAVNSEGQSWPIL